MTVRIEAGRIYKNDGKFNRIMSIVYDSGLILSEIVSSDYIEDLEIIDHEN